MNNTLPKWLHFCVHSLFYPPEHVSLVHLLKSNGFSLTLNETGEEGGDKIKTTGKQRPSLYLGPDFHVIFQVFIHFWFLFRQRREKPTISATCLHSSNLCHTVKSKKNSLLKENEPKFLDCEVRSDGYVNGPVLFNEKNIIHTWGDNFLRCEDSEVWDVH